MKTKASEKVMTKVMHLLNLANDPNATEAERLLAEEHAERLMAQHMIDRMDLTQEEKSRAIQDEWTITFKDDSENFEFTSFVFQLLQEVLRHCGVRIHPKTKYVKGENGFTDYNKRSVVMVGFPEDIAYAERVWFNIFRAFVSNVQPSWDITKPFSENVYDFIRAGHSWQDVHEYAYNAAADHYGLPERGKGGGSKLRRAYKEELEKRGEEWHVTRRNKAYRSSFARSFSSTVSKRLTEIRSKAKDSVSDDNKFAVALRDTKERVDEEFYKLFPEFDPEVRRKQRVADEFERACSWASLSEAEQRKVLRDMAAEEARYARRARRARANYGRVRESDRTDMAAWERGRKVGEKVNLRADTEVKKDKKGVLE